MTNEDPAALQAFVLGLFGSFATSFDTFTVYTGIDPPIPNSEGYAVTGHISGTWNQADNVEIAEFAMRIATEDGSDGWKVVPLRLPPTVRGE